MNRGKGQVQSRLGGYTIVETLIFLAVSAAMFFAAIVLISGQQNKAQFVNAVRDLEAQLKDVANNVSTGYYAHPGDLTCPISGSGLPEPQNGGDVLGSSGNCMFVGVVVKLGNGSGEELTKYSTIPMAGLRLAAGTNKDARTLGESKPIAVQPSVETKTLQYGTRIGGVSINGAPFANNNAGIGFYAKLRGTDDITKGGSLQTDVLTYQGVAADDVVGTAITAINADTFNYDNPVSDGSSLNPNEVTICLLSGTTNQHAFIRLGGKGGNLTIVSEIQQGGTCT